MTVIGGRYRCVVPEIDERSPAARKALQTLDELTASLAGGETRDAQRIMTAAVADAVASGRHLVVEAGTGTGKSLAYLVGAGRSAKRIVVATATKALQDQLSGKDLPFVTEHDDLPLSFAVLKGRSNYVCLQRIAELNEKSDDAQGTLIESDDAVSARELDELTEWAMHSPTGDRAELTSEPSARTWAAVSMTALECPGAARCPKGAECFAERARAAATEADVIVVNQHLWGLHLAGDSMLLPEHDVVIIDEAHQLVDVISSTAGRDLSESTFTTASRAARAVLDDPDLIAGLDTIAANWAITLGPFDSCRLTDGITGELADLLTLATRRAEAVVTALRNVDPGGHEKVATRRDRALNLCAALVDDLHCVANPPEGSVLWVGGSLQRPTLHCSPIDVAGVLADQAWDAATAVLTSATIPKHFAATVGLDAGLVDVLRLESPFDYESNSLLYCPAALAAPNTPGYASALYDELEALISAAGGATLALFTSYRAMDDAVDELRTRLELPILSQRDLPKPALVAEFAGDRATCLFATQSFFQGVDIPGEALQLVTIDRIPFPRPDDPLLQARRDTIGPGAFAQIDVPRAAMSLAQAAGRLIRHTDDKGVVAVLDSRFANKRSYRWDLINALPPMPRTRHRNAAEAFLTKLRSETVTR